MITLANPRSDWTVLRPLLFESIGQTLTMVLITLVVGGLLGLILGVVLYGTRPGNLFENAIVYRILDVIVNIVRPIPFIIFLAAMGNTVISFAKDLSLSVGASAALSTTLVGVLAVCNGLGRILTGALFDTLGRRRTMLLANGAAILAALVTLLSVAVHSVPLCVAGLCITGISYGACPTISSAFPSSFYGAKYFSLNFSVMNFNLTGASFIATAASVLLTQTGGYAAPLVLLLVLAVAALALNLNIKRP